MNRIKTVVLIVLSFVATTIDVCGQRGGKLKMWYDKPAKNWNEALPIGNGRISAMVFGNPAKEQLQLNESSFWSGGPSRNDNPDGLIGLDSIRKAIFDENYKLANNLSNKYLTAKKLHGSKFQVVGSLFLSFEGTENYTNYYRELDLEKAVFTTTYNVGDVTYKREVFSSQPDQVIVVRLTASKSGQLSFTAGFDGGQLQKTSIALDAKTLEMTGVSGTHEGVTGQVKFDARAKIINIGGTTTAELNKIKVSNANEVVIVISAATNFVDYKTLTANEVDRCIQYLSAAEKKNHILFF